MQLRIGKLFIGAIVLSVIQIFPMVALSQTGGENKKIKTSMPAISKSNKQILETCFKCHGPGGVSQIPTHPTIAGQKTGYLVNQLNAFKRSQDQINKPGANKPNKKDKKRNLAISGRDDAIMNHMVQGLRKSDFAPLAIYISLLPCDGNIKSDKTEATKKVTKKTARPKAPAAIARCVSCHGKNGISSSPNTPNLAGQKRAYLRRELLLMRETAWGGRDVSQEQWRTHPIMERQAARLRIEDVDSISNYYAKLNCSGKK